MTMLVRTESCFPEMNVRVLRPAPVHTVAAELARLRIFVCCCHRLLHWLLVNTEIGPGVLRYLEEQAEGVHDEGQLYDGVVGVPGDGGDGLVARDYLRAAWLLVAA